MNLKEIVRSFPDFPQKGVIFRDIMPILRDPRALAYVVTEFKKKSSEKTFDLIAGIESRGFVFGSCLAYDLGKGFIAVRKQGKLPGRTVARSYSIEYGSATIEMQEDAVRKGDRVLVVDDLLATGGTAQASAQLIDQLGGVVVGFMFVIELLSLRGREKLRGNDVFSLISYE